MSPDPGVSWVVTGNGVEVVGEKVGEPRAGMQLWQIDPPARFRNTQTGIYPTGGSASARPLAVRAENDEPRGFAKVTVSRQGACNPKIPVADVTVRVGPLGVVDDQPGFARVDDVVRRKLAPCSTAEPAFVRATVPYHVEVTVSPTFVPDEVDGGGDRRALGAQVGFDFIPLGEEG